MPDSQFFAREPEAVGVDSAKLEALFQRVQQEVDEGLLPACQVAIGRQGKLAALKSFGDAINDNLFSIFSATKGITSAAAWLLIQEGKLNVDTLVKELIPEFASNGKEIITVEMLFTHTAGLPYAPFRPSDWLDHSRRLERYAQWTLNWAPGSRYEYHPTSSMWVIAELIERASNMDFAEFVQERIAKLLGLVDMHVGAPEEVHTRIKDVTHVGEPMTAADYEALGMPVPPDTEVTPEVLLAFNTSEVRKIPVPGGGGHMGAGEIALFYQTLINGGKSPDGEQLWTRDTLDYAFKVRNNFPDMLGIPANRALGVVISGDAKRNGRGFGHTNSNRAVGHNGAGGQLAWGDHQTGISLGYVTNGHDAHAVRQARRGISISNKAAVCGLAT